MSKDAVSAKVGKLKEEGEETDQAVATAMNMKRKGRLGKRGGYKRGKKRGSKRS
jgi:hypothetical protein